MADKFAIASQALVLVGHPPIASFDGPSSGSIIAKAFYEDTILELLGLHRWRHATRAVALTRLADAPLTQWSAAYALPAGCQIIHTVQVNGSDIQFDRFADQIHCDASPGDTVVLLEGVRTDEASWPPYFAALARLKLASVFAVPVAESDSKASLYESKFVRQLTQARLIDSQGRTATKIGLGGLRAYHGGRP